MQATELSREQRRALLSIARETVTEAVRQSPPPSPAEFPDDFPGHGAFVTLHRLGALRGCIGSFASSPSTVDTIREMARAATLRDPRFQPVQADELAEIDLEISLLTPLQPLDDPDSVEVGRHGLCISRGYQRGVLLPQVASENGWDRELFLDQTCLKAGLPVHAWRDADTRIETFEAVVFGEKSERML